MIKSILKYSALTLLIIICNLVIIIPGLFKLIIPHQMFGLIEFYLKNVNLPGIIIFIIIQLLTFFFIKTKRYSLVKTVLPISLFLYLLIIIIEHPQILNQEILYKKPFDIKFVYASLDYHHSLPDQTKYEIYKIVVDMCTPCILVDSLYSNHSVCYYRAPTIRPMSDSLLSLFQNDWRANGIENEFYSNNTDVIDSHYMVIGNYRGILTFTPIKRVDNDIIFGYKLYSGPLAAFGGYYKCIKENNKWRLEPCGPMWIS